MSLKYDNPGRFFLRIASRAPASSDERLIETIAPVKSPRYNPPVFRQVSGETSRNKFKRSRTIHDSKEQSEQIPGQVAHSRLPLDFPFYCSVHTGRRRLRLKTATLQQIFFRSEVQKAEQGFVNFVTWAGGQQESLDNTIRLWDLTVGQEVFIFREPGSARSITFSPGGRHLAAANNGGFAKLWSVAEISGVKTMRG